jgi:hypothetical protein
VHKLLLRRGSISVVLLTTLGVIAFACRIGYLVFDVVLSYAYRRADRRANEDNTALVT